MAQPISFLLNDLSVTSDLPPATVVLDYLRREQGLTGTKEVCREGDCGACMVLVGESAQANGAAAVVYKPVNSCLLPLGDVAGRHVVSVEGLNLPPPHRHGRSGAEASLPLNPVQRHMVEQGAIQCGFCTPGFVVALSGFLLNAGELTLAQGVQAVAGNICRCTGYASIRRAIACLLEEYLRHCAGGPPIPGPQRLASLVGYGVLPPYFHEIPGRLARLPRPERPAGRLRQRAGAGVRPPVWIAGGTDLFVQRPEELLAEEVSFVSRRAGFTGGRVRGEYLQLGAGTTMEELGRLPEVRRHLPQLAEALQLVASTPIRERATIAGNIVNASPIGDLTIMLLALGARLGIRPGATARVSRSVREAPLEEFFQAYKSLALGQGEVVEWVAVPLSGGLTRGAALFSFEKVSRRQHLDIASVNSAAQFRAEGARVSSARLSAGGVAPVPLLLARASSALSDREVNDRTVGEVLELAQEEIAPISDVRGSAQYKRLLLRQLLLAHFLKCFPGRLREEAWA